MQTLTKIDIEYDLPECFECKTKQNITRIDISTQKDLLDRSSSMIISTVCQNMSCPKGIMQSTLYRLYDPDTHRIHKKPKKKGLNNGF